MTLFVAFLQEKDSFLLFLQQQFGLNFARDAVLNDEDEKRYLSREASRDLHSSTTPSGGPSESVTILVGRCLVVEGAFQQSARPSTSGSSRHVRQIGRGDRVGRRERFGRDTDSDRLRFVYACV